MLVGGEEGGNGEADAKIGAFGAPRAFHSVKRA